MPNILEQQDLLKGLPDERLSMLMQSPTGDIPPFLVAAEAQRRQSIREQFSGGPQESVVDTLTKQLANVPQNIQAPAQQPPQMPQMPQMGGVAALQQGMRAGGYVRRYAPGGMVAPLQTRVQDIADQFGVTVDQAAEMLKNNPSLAGTTPEADYGTPPPITEMNREPSAPEMSVDLPNLTISPAELAVKQREANREAKYQEMDSYPGYGGSTAAVNKTPYQYGMTGDERRNMPTTAPRDPTGGKADTSTENQAKTDMTVDEYRAYLEKIYGTNAEDSEYIRAKLKELYAPDETSGWEKSQKWFAAAQAAIQPGQSDMQAAISALSALGGGYAQENADKRASQRDLAEALLRQEIADRQAKSESTRDIEKGVLDYRLSEEERDRSTRSATAERQLDAIKWQSQQAMEDAKILQSQVADYESDLNRHISDLRKNGFADDVAIASDPTVVALTKKINELNTKAQNAMLRARRYREAFAGATGSRSRVEFADGDTMGYLD